MLMGIQIGIKKHRKVVEITKVCYFSNIGGRVNLLMCVSLHTPLFSISLSLAGQNLKSALAFVGGHRTLIFSCTRDEYLYTIHIPWHSALTHPIHETPRHRSVHPVNLKVHRVDVALPHLFLPLQTPLPAVKRIPGSSCFLISL